MRRAKIVCTLGPASSSAGMIDRLVRAGMDLARLNFSHGNHGEYERIIRDIREASRRHATPVGIISDLQGPRIRTGRLIEKKPVSLRAGQRFTLSTSMRPGDESGVSTNFRRLPREVRRGDRILLADGLIELRVLRTGTSEVHCEVVNGGVLGENKGMNLPGVALRVPSLTFKDRKDLAFAVDREVDYVAVSFVRRAEDVRAARAAMKRLGRGIPIIAKLEKPEAVANIDSILREADGIMVARGDLGVEMPPEMVPVVQKQLIARARDYRLPVITATQMLESMTHNPRPTRAEASDVANAIFDGSDAVMLSAETATGQYPLESVRMMERIIIAAEESVTHSLRPNPPARLNVAETISEAICHAAEELRLKVIAVFTQTGSTARLVSKYRPRSPIIAFSPEEETRRRLSLFWGVVSHSIEPLRDIDSLAELAERRLLEERLVSKGDVVGVVAGTPLGTRGSTNFMKLHVIGGRTASRPSRRA